MADGGLDFSGDFGGLATDVVGSIDSEPTNLVSDPGFVDPGGGGQGFGINPRGFNLAGREPDPGQPFGGDYTFDREGITNRLDTGAPQGPRGFGGFASNLMGEIEQSPLKALTTAFGVGQSGFNIANQLRASGQLAGAEKRAKTAQEQAQAAAAPAVAAGTQDIQRAEAGKLQPAMEASIQEFLNKGVADIKGKFAAMGIPGSSQEQQAIEELQLKAQSMRAQLLQSEEALGGQLLQTGVSGAAAGGNISTQQQQLLSQIIAGGNDWLGRLTGRQA